MSKDTDLLIMQRYFDCLKEIGAYASADKLIRAAPKYGQPGNVVLEMAYDNVIRTARIAIGKRRRPGGLS